MRLPAANESDDAGINMTPVIDVVFLLLIFFLVATRFDQQERELKVALPEVAKAQPVSSGQDMIVNITAEGKYIIQQQTYSETQLAAVLNEFKKNNPHLSVVIRGDGRSAWRHGVRVMGLCNAANIENYRVAALEEK